MTGVTVEQLADSVGVQTDRLLKQLEQAGVPAENAQVVITEPQKQALIAHLKKDLPSISAILEPKKITLKRKSVSEIKVTSATGRKTTVSVVSKRQRIYVKKEANADVVLEEPPKAIVEPTPQAVEANVAEAVTPSDTAVTPSTATTEPVSELTTPADTGFNDSPAPKHDKAPVASKGKRDIEDELGRKKARSAPKPHAAPAEDWRRAPEILESEEIAEEVTPEPNPAAAPTTPAKPAQQARSPMARPKKARPKPRFEDRYSRRAPRAEAETRRHGFEKPVGPVVREIQVPETITVAELANRMSIKAGEVIKALFKMGVMTTINQSLDQTTAVLVVEEMGHSAKLAKDSNLDQIVVVENLEESTPRAPIITVMGHVDHGKTSLLDYIRRTKVTAGEAGGITQHIGAYHVKTKRGAMTFLDTPGHAAFTAMRARGAQCTDIVVLVIASDDGVMPQTVEAIKHAKAAKAPIVVALTKSDKNDADLDRIYNECGQHELIPESWGGDVMFVPVSAKTGDGIDALLEAILLSAEMLELQAPTKGPATGVVLEARLDKGRGPIASVLVRSGSLKSGDILLAGVEYGRVRAMNNEQGQKMSHAGPSIPVEVLGLSGTPAAGDEFVVVPDERKAREVAGLRQTKQRDVRLARQQASKLEGLFDRMQQSETKALNIVIKTDVQGTAEALSEALENLSTQDVKVKIVANSVGSITESDINLCMASQALMIGFNVRADATARRLAEAENVELNYFSIIYDVVDRIKSAMTGLLSPQFKENILGLALVREVFRSAKLGAVAGCMVTEGNIKRGKPIRVLRENVVIYQGELESLRRFKDDLQEVRNGMECGIAVKNYNDVRVGDQIEVYEVIQVAATL